MTDQIMLWVPLRQTYLADENPRNPDTVTGIDELAESIKTLGLIQPLICYGEDYRFFVCGGGRRWRAMGKLVDDGDWDEAKEIPIISIPKSQAESFGVAENSFRQDMNEFDLMVAFATMNDKGYPPESIARAFNVTASYVKATVAVGALPQPILDAAKAGDLDIRELKAFTAAKTPAQAMSVFESYQSIEHNWNKSSRAIMRMIADGKDDVTVGDKTFQFVGAEAYEAAGGTLISDLFDTSAAIVEDVDLLHKLRDDKLAAAEADLRDEGWSFVTVEPDAAVYSIWQRFNRVEGNRKISDEEFKELETLEEMMPEEAEAMEGFDARLRELEALHDDVDWPDKTDLGVHVHIGYHGELKIMKGLKVAGDQPELSADGEEENPLPAYSASVSQDLRRLWSDKLAVELAKKPELCIDIVAWALTCHQSVFDVHQQQHAESIEEMSKSWDKPFFGWPTKQTRNKALATAVASSIHSLGGSSQSMVSFNTVARQMGFDLRKHWTPDEEFWRRLKIVHLVEIWNDLCDPEHMIAVGQKMKKGVIVAKLHDLFAGKLEVTADRMARINAWLPEPVVLEMEEKEEEAA